MPIIRNSDQKSKSLIEFYNELKDSSNAISMGMGNLMLNWLERINKEFLETTIWGLTSHDRLVLQNENESTAKAYIVLTTGISFYHIEYLLPEESQPWENAYVKGVTSSLDDAMVMLKIAMINSKGWKETAELAIK